MKRFVEYRIKSLIMLKKYNIYIKFKWIVLLLIIIFQLISLKELSKNIIKNLEITTSLRSKCNYDFNGPKIYCAILTHHGNLDTKALSVNKTWGNKI